MNTRITIADVAREAAVSTQTVSRAINDKGEIRPETRSHVLAVAKRLGYRPNTLARALATDRTYTLGLVVPDVANPYFAEVIRGAEDAALPHDYTIFLCNTNEDPYRELKLLTLLEDKRVDGVILCSPALDNRNLTEHLARQRAVVVVNHPPLPHTVGAIWVNNVLGTQLAVEHLWTQGRRDIGLLYGIPETFSRRQRRQTFVATMIAHGLAPDAQTMEACAPQMEDGRRAARMLLQRSPTLNALVCHNDLVAVGALQACAELGRRVPEDVAVIGFDNIPLSHLVWPALSTIHYPIARLGEQAVEMLLRHVNTSVKLGERAQGNGNAPGTHLPEEICVAPELVLRASTPGCLAVDDAAT
ncbi:MAG: LacI family DNA-binding transcriptional regulator [Caldilineaceae bacterium]